MQGQNEIRILLVSSKPDCVKTIRDAFARMERSIEWHIASSLQEARAALQSPPDLMLLATHLDDGEGEELLPGAYHQHHLPIIMLAREEAESEAIRALRLGALFYVVENRASLMMLPQVVDKVLGKWPRIIKYRDLIHELQTRGSLFDYFFENLRDIAFIIDEQGMVVYANAAAGRMADKPAFDLVGSRFIDYIGEGYRDAASADFARVLQGEVVDSLFELIDGRCYAVKSKPLHTPDGRIEGAFGIARDVTEQQKAQDALTFDNLLLTTQQETLPGAILVVDEHNKIISYNRNLLQMWHLSESVMEAGDEAKPLERATEQLLDPEAFLARIRYLYDHPEERCHQELQLKDGRTIERFSAPVVDRDGHHYGRLWYFIDISDRKRAETQQAHLAAIVESSGDGIIGKQADGTVTSWNRGAERIYGYSAREMLGHSILRVVPPELHDAFMALMARVASGETVRGHEAVRIHKDGTRIEVAVTLSPIRDKAGKISGVSAISQDITERRQSERALGESQRIARLGSYRLDIATSVWSSTPVLDEILGIDPQGERVLESWLRVVHPDERDEMLRYYRQEVLEKKQLFDREYRIIRASDSEERWVHGRGELQLDARGEPMVMIGTIQDITERKQAEASIRMLSSAITQIDEAVMITDPMGVIEYVNDAFVEITGFSAQEALGHNANLLNSDVQDERFFDRMWDALEAGESWRGRIINKRKDSGFYPCLLTISPIVDSAGRISHYVGIQQDLKSYEELEAQFRQSQKMEAVGALVGGIAHDFNNALAGITGNTYLARRDMDGESAASERLDAIEMLADRAAGMIRQLLTFSRKGEAEMRPLSIDPFVKEVVKLQRVSVPESIELRLDYEREPMEINGDANVLQQVLVNLINNARDALEGVEKPVIDVRLASFVADEAFEKRHPEVTARQFVTLSVADNGHGIEPEHMEHLFEPFYTTKQAGKGTGLGLSMAYGAMQTHDGAIEVASTPGGGTIFTLYLPRLDIERDGDGVRKARDQNGNIAHGQGETILLADDNADLLAMGREILEQLGYRVLIAANGEEAVEVYRSHRAEIDLLLFDVVMPKMGGVEAYKAIHAIDPQVKVLFATGYDMGNALDGEQGVEADMLITKPYAISQLSQLVQKRLQG